MYYGMYGCILFCSVFFCGCRCLVIVVIVVAVTVVLSCDVWLLQYLFNEYTEYTVRVPLGYTCGYAPLLINVLACSLSLLLGKKVFGWIQGATEFLVKKSQSVAIWPHLPCH